MPERGKNYIVPSELLPKQPVLLPFAGPEYRELIEHSDHRLSTLRRERRSYFDHWREISTYISPRRGKWVEGSKSKQDEGGRKHGKIINNMAGKASRIAASGLHNGITPRSRPWFNLTVAPGTGLENDAEVIRWLHIVQQIIYEVFERSNWYPAMRTNYGEVGDYGTGVVSINENFANVIRCRQHTIGSYYLGANHLGTTDTFYEEFTLTVSQMVQRYEWDQLSTKVQMLFDNGDKDAWVGIVRAIEPNGGYYDPDGIGWQRTPYRMIEYDPADSEGQPLMLKGIEEFPFFVGKGEEMSDEAYGTDSFGMQALDDVKGLQAYEHRKARMVAQIADPAMNYPTALRGKIGAARPGEKVFYDEVNGGTQGARPIYVPDPRISEIRLDMDAIELRINYAYHREVFQAISTMRDGGNRRELEIDARIREQMGQLGPVTESHVEGLDVAIQRVYGICERAGILPDPPRQLVGVPIKVDYISILAQAQKAQNVNSMVEYASIAGNLQQAGFRKGAVRFNDDAFMKNLGQKLGVPPDMVRSDEEVEEQIRREQEATQRMQQAELQKTYAESAKTASDAELEDGSTVLDAAMQAAGAGGAPQ